MSSDMNDFKDLVRRVAAGDRLGVESARQAFDIMMSGDATPAQMGGFLLALRVRGETVEEITGGAMALRRRAVEVEAPEGAIDTCGTGGDGSGSFNISTASAIVAAGAGLPVAKHGNRAVSSKSGSADVLTALGVNLDADMALVEKCLREANIGFLLAPRHHGAMRHVAGTRVELGTRTIFNLLGPLSNPAGAKRQLLGVFAEQWVEPLAQVLRNLGSERVWVVHAFDGMDELSTTGSTKVAELKDGEVRNFEVTPQALGLPVAEADDLKGGDAQANAAIMRALLAGEKGPIRDIVLLNSGAALIVGAKAESLAEGIALAGEAIDTGAARGALDKLVAISNEGADAA